MSTAAADVGVIAGSPAVITAVLTELGILGNHALADRMGTFCGVGHSSHLDINLSIRPGNYNTPGLRCGRVRSAPCRSISRATRTSHRELLYHRRRHEQFVGSKDVNCVELGR